MTTTAKIYETQDCTIEDGQEVWHTDAAVLDENGDVVVGFYGPVGEEWLPDAWDAALLDAGYRRVSDWDLTDYVATVEPAEDTMITFDEIVAEARRRNPDWTDAEWDYSLAAPTGCRDGIAELGHAAYVVANRHLPDVTPDGPDDLAEREANCRALIEATAAERTALVAAAKAKSYSGWSVHSAGPIRYA